MERPCGFVKAHVERIRERLRVRAMALEADGTAMIVVSLDTLGFPFTGRFTAEVRQAIHERCGIPPGHVLLAASHTHTGGPLWGLEAEALARASPLVRRLVVDHGVSCSASYRDRVVTQTVVAACAAFAGRGAATLSVGRGTERSVAHNRRFRMTTGRVSTNPGKGNPCVVAAAGPVDPEVGVLGAWDAAGELLGCVVNYGCHCTAADDGESATAADYVHHIDRTIAGAFGEQATVVFLPGACGDVAQVDGLSMRPLEVGPAWSRRVGVSVGAEAARTLATSEHGRLVPLRVASRSLRARRRRLGPERLADALAVVEGRASAGEDDAEWVLAKEALIADYLAREHPAADIEVQALQVGPAVLLANPSELFAESGLAIKRASPFAHTFVVTMANGSAGYAPPRPAFAPDGGGYETVLTSYSNLEAGTAERVVAASAELASRFTPGAVPTPPRLTRPEPPWPYGALGPDA